MGAQKNILILHTDMQRYDSLGCNGNPYAVTPNIDKLAEDSLVFTRHIASNPVCMPSRASLFTGMTVAGHGTSVNGVPLWRNDKIGVSSSTKKMWNNFPEKIPTLADVLGDAGYETLSIGKLHLQPHLAKKEFGFEEAYSTWEDEEMESWDGPFYGFQKVKLVVGHGDAPCSRNHGHYGRWLWKNHPEEASKVLDPSYHTHVAPGRDDVYCSVLPEKLHNSTWIADEMIAYIEQRKEEDKPFFAFAGFPDPHVPYGPPADTAETFLNAEVLKPAPLEGIEKKPQRVQKSCRNPVAEEVVKMAARNTAAMVNLIDRSVGRIIESLKEKGLYEDTIIIFTSDHGEYLGDYGKLTKDLVADMSLVRIPFVIKPCDTSFTPGKIDKPMSNCDVMPTLLAMVGVEKPKNVQGVDIFHCEEEHTPVVDCYSTGQESINFSLITDYYRYTYYPHTGEEELYDHRVDPQELNNLAYEATAENRTICEKLNHRLLRLHVKYDTRMANIVSPW